MRAIRKHLRDFIALIVLLVIALGVTGYILSNQRLYLPAWVPGVGHRLLRVNAEFPTAQAVVPGQGQTVNIAGVPVGEIGKVELRERRRGRADEDPHEVRADLPRRAHAAAPEDRPQGHDPRDGPGHQGGRRAARRTGTIPVANTLPDVNLDEILSSLDTDTRDYLRILLNAGGEAFAASPALRPTCARPSSASSPPTATSRRSTGSSPSGAATSRASSTTSGC